MGDWVRRICYPLFLPAIVLAVWAHAWSAKMDAGHVRLPPTAPSAAHAAPPTPPQRWAPEYGLSQGDDEGFASTGDDAE